MPFVGIRKARKQGAINASHWLWPLVRQGIIARPDLDIGRPATRATVKSAPLGNSGGLTGLLLSGSGGHIAQPSRATSEPWTLISYGVPRSLASVCALATMAEAPGNSTRDRSLYIISATGAVGAYVYDGSDKSAATTTGVVVVDEPVLVAAVSTGTTIGAYCKGQLVTAATSNAGYTAYTTPELVHGYGGGTLGAGATNASAFTAFYQVLLFGGLPKALLDDLASDPKAPLRPRRIMVEVAGGGAASLILADAAHAHAADSLVLTTASTLAIADATHAHAADALTLVTGSTLAVADATHAHASDAVTVSVQSSLAVADAAHAHAADAPALTVQSALVVADASHGHAAEAPALVVQSVLAVADAAHAHAADNVTLAVAGATTLAVADATHAHTVDGLTLTAASVLAIQEALHAHAADGITLDAGGATNLLLADGLHAHTSDGLALVVDAWLVVADAAHGHRADSVVLTFGGATVDPATIRRVARSLALPRLVRGAVTSRITRGI